MRIRLGWIAMGWFIASSGWAQSTDRIHYSVELGAYAATGTRIPFWLRSNQYGIVPIDGPLATGRLSIRKEYRQQTDSAHTKRQRFDWGFGAKGVVNGSRHSAIHSFTYLLPEAFAKIRLGKVEFWGGNRMEVVGLGDSVLSSGAVAWSGNALPFPKIQLHTPDFVSLGFIKQLIAFRVGYAHGWFVNSYIKGSYLHQKYVYGRFGKPHWRVRVYIGLNHQVQWGGQADYLIGTPLAVNGKLPTSFQDYISMITGRYPDALQNDRFTDFDGTNRIGNHIGSYDAGLEWNGSTANWLLYHQHLYEDASGLALRNIPDGLTGLRFKNLRTTAINGFRLRRMVLEWLCTTNQSGPTFDPTARFQGGDNYFNHSQYRQGWSYQGRTLGTPLLVPYTDMQPGPANLGGPFFPNNRVLAWYTGFEGSFKNGPTLVLRTSYSRNLGTYNQPYPKPIYQLSTLLSAQWPLNKRTLLTTSMAVDRGDLLPNSVGGFISLRKFR